MISDISSEPTFAPSSRVTGEWSAALCRGGSAGSCASWLCPELQEGHGVEEMWFQYGGCAGETQFASAVLELSWAECLNCG